MTLTSTTYTMGTALSRAQDNQVPVALLVEGHWMRGHVVAIDGHGVVLNSDGAEHSVVRMERVSAVRVMTATPAPTTMPDKVSAPCFRASPEPHQHSERLVGPTPPPTSRNGSALPS